ncbi:hypothetical protein [Micromonospora sp. NPDC093277]|uniref:hypothetical protein n=1 Tax=Micromonospora sp. NPDC093277 TaxID=3364291 RepID=UPI00382C1E8C
MEWRDVASQGTPTNPAGRRRPAITIALCGGLAAIVVLLVVIPIRTGGSWGVLNSLRSSSSATPEPGPTSKPTSDLGAGAPAAPLIRACLKQTKGLEVYDFYLRDIPEDRWGEPVSGTLIALGEPYVLWLFDADCKPYRAVAVPRGDSRTFTAYVGQVWHYAEAPAKQPGDSFNYRVFSPSNSDAWVTFSDTGRLIYRTE